MPSEQTVPVTTELQSPQTSGHRIKIITQPNDLINYIIGMTSLMKTQPQKHSLESTGSPEAQLPRNRTNTQPNDLTNDLIPMTLSQETQP